jgi:hypothetical protein
MVGSIVEAGGFSDVFESGAFNAAPGCNMEDMYADGVTHFVGYVYYGDLLSSEYARGFSFIRMEGSFKRGGWRDDEAGAKETHNYDRRIKPAPSA